MGRGAGLRLLDADPEFGLGLDEVAREEARRAIVLPALVLEAGPWTVGALAEQAPVLGEPFGIMVLEGAVLGELELGGRTCARVFLPGDLVLFGGEAVEALPVGWRWSSLGTLRALVLDDRVLRAQARWPQVGRRLQRRAARQMEHGFVLQAIAQLPRVEERLVGLFWFIAERAGRVRADGVHVGLALTHGTLGDMLGARRPTVSLALKALAADGVLWRDDDAWVLARDSIGVLGTAVSGAPSHTEPPSAALFDVARDARTRAEREPTRSETIRAGSRELTRGAEDVRDESVAGDRPAVTTILEVGPKPLLGSDIEHEVRTVADAAGALATLETFSPSFVVVHSGALANPSTIGRLVGRLDARSSLRQTRLLLVDDRDVRALSGRFAARADAVLRAPMGADALLAWIDTSVAGPDRRGAEVLGTDGSMGCTDAARKSAQT